MHPLHLIGMGFFAVVAAKIGRGLLKGWFNIAL
jgi:hypothetical protein